jgi:hypothetical protein
MLHHGGPRSAGITGQKQTHLFQVFTPCAVNFLQVPSACGGNHAVRP